MKNTLCSSLLLVLVVHLSSSIQAQQLPPLVHGSYDPSWYNPATLSSEEGGLTALTRQQWIGQESASATTYLLQADLSQPLGLERAGLGLRLLQDNIHIVQNTAVQIQFAYDFIPDIEEWRFVIGVQGGLQFQRLSFGSSRISDPNDLLLFSETANQMGFRAGPGLLLEYQDKQVGNRFQLGLSLPQLYASDLNYEENFLYTLSPHYQATAAYRFGINSKTYIEPRVNYRSTLGERKFKGGNVDAGLQAGFLEDRFNVLLGTRVNANSYHIGASFMLMDQLVISTIMDYNTILGSSLEVGVRWRWNKLEKEDAGSIVNTTPTPPSSGDAGPYAKEGKQRLDDRLIGIVEEVNATKASFMETEATLMIVLVQGETYLQNGNESASVTDKAYYARKARQYLQEVESKQNPLDAYRQFIAEKEAQLDDVLRAARFHDWSLKREQKYTEEIKEISREIENKGNRITFQIKEFNRNLERFENALGVWPQDLAQRLAAGDNVQVAALLQARLDQLADKPANMQAVEVESLTNGNTGIMYHFPSNTSQYNLSSPTLKAERSFLDHLSASLLSLQEQGISIQRIQITGRVDVDNSDLELPSIRQYQGEYGSTVTIEHSLQPSPNGPITAANPLKVSAGEIDSKAEIGLRLYSMQQYLQQVPQLSTIPKDLIISAGHTMQTSNQVFEVVIEVK